MIHNCTEIGHDPFVWAAQAIDYARPLRSFAEGRLERPVFRNLLERSRAFHQIGRSLLIGRAKTTLRAHWLPRLSLQLSTPSFPVNDSHRGAKSFPLRLPNHQDVRDLVYIFMTGNTAFLFHRMYKPSIELVRSVSSSPLNAALISRNSVTGCQRTSRLVSETTRFDYHYD